ncbi:DNA gyrase inhibitor [Paenibacillus nanensis]|uniref:DNA gyrase inhibitor n=1 Tax=Paenibacillus nanensis TaxID=393251 RepID=A0A3A1VGA7_9BACL|nr:GyrI-like domain-containing protein [Paenibacillus nanensis]RIX59401.1 DNA gyrase inhibitor [Paenibacillus nanensis]
MKTRVDMLPNYRIAYMRHIGPYGPSNAQIMESLKKWAQEEGLLTESAILFGIPQDNPRTTLPEKCRYDACIVIPEDFLMNEDGICEGKLLGGEYVLFKIKHTAEEIQKAWAEIFPALHSMGVTVDDKPILEVYTGNMLLNDYCEIGVPIKSS